MHSETLNNHQLALLSADFFPLRMTLFSQGSEVRQENCPFFFFFAMLVFLLYKALGLPRVQFQMHCHLAAEITPISLHQIREMEFSRHVVSACGIQVSVISKLTFQAPWNGGGAPLSLSVRSYPVRLLRWGTVKVSPW